jgi:hypothetical protein
MSSPQIPQSTIDFYEKMNSMQPVNVEVSNPMREDRRRRGLGMRLNAPALDEAAPWAIKSGGKRKSRRHKRSKKSNKSKKSKKSFKKSEPEPKTSFLMKNKK